MTMTSNEMSADETVALIGSDKVEGTAVYAANGDHLGRIERVMLDKKSGRASFAVLSFGGFLGFGTKHHPLPWEQLTYDRKRDGYVVALTTEQLKGAPSYDSADEPDWSSAETRDGISGYYGRTNSIAPGPFI